MAAFGLLLRRYNYGDAAFGFDLSGINTGFVESLRLGGGDVHGNVVGEFVRAADHVGDDADLGAVDVGVERALGFDAGEAAERHVFADLADESLANVFERGVTELAGSESGDVGPHERIRHRC